MSPPVWDSRAEPTALEVVGIRKVYGGEIALADASLSIRRGEIHALLGANGAGKSTLVRIISGVESQDAGTVRIAGEDLPRPHTAAAAQARGLALIHQDRALVGDLSIAENMALTMGYPRRRPRAFIDFDQMRANARQALARVGLERDVDALARDVPIADQTLVAIARALAIDARVILLDEPTANLGMGDSELVYERLQALADDGVACLLITHHLGEALRVCQRVTVLRNGRVVATRPSSETDENDLATMVVGHAIQPGAGSADHGHRERAPVFTLRGARCDRLGPLSLELMPGEIVGVTGLADSGHLLLGELATGARGLDAGGMTANGAPFRPRGPAHARKRGVASVPADRLRDGLAVQMSARENLFFDGQAVRGLVGIPPRRERAAAADLLRRANVRPPEPEAVLSTLSGGNMQKVLVGKWLATRPDVLVLCEPTVGIDVGAREEIYQRLREATANGMSILLASSDFEEVATLSDRILVIRYGSVEALLPARAATAERLAALSSGGTASARTT